MEQQPFIDRVCGIMQRAFDLRQQGKADVFVWFHPHCDSVDIMAHPGGWSRESPIAFKTFSIKDGQDAMIESAELYLSALIRNPIKMIIRNMIESHGSNDRRMISLGHLIADVGDRFPMVSERQQEAISMDMDDEIREILHSSFNWKGFGHFLTVYMLADPGFAIEQYQTA